MRRMFLMSSVLLVAPFVFGETGEASAQCVATQDCASLGYTETSCPNGGIKCPFGNTWNCKGDGTTAKANCEVGWILYSDKTCSSVENRDITKTPIGVVVYSNHNAGGIAIALTPFYECPNLDKNFSKVLSNSLDAKNDFDSCGNTELIYGDTKGVFGTYSTKGTTAGDWCMPAAGVMNLIAGNREIIGNTMDTLGSYGFRVPYDGYTYYVSSTVSNNEPDYYGRIETDYWAMVGYKNSSQISWSSGIGDTSSTSGSRRCIVYPVIAF